MKTTILVGMLVSILSAIPAQAANHELYTQLRWARRAAYYAQRDQMMIERERQKTERLLRSKYERAAQAEGRIKARAMELAQREANKNHPAAAFGELPIKRDGLPEDQMKQMADRFRAEHGVVIKPRKVKQ